MKKFFTSKIVWLCMLIGVVLIGWLLVHNASSGIPDGVETGVVERGDVVEVVSETGYVQAAQAVDMAFERGGRVVEILAQAGSEVEEGDVMIRLDQSSVAADLSAAYARLEAEQVRLRELLAGADVNSLAVTESVVVSAQTGLANAQRNLTEVTTQQNQLLKNAEKTLRVAGLQAYLLSAERQDSVDTFVAPTVTGTYADDEEGVYILELYNSGTPSGSSFRVSGLETGSGPVSTVSPAPVGTRGLFVQFPEGFAKRTRWEIPVPNTRSALYLQNQNTLKAVRDGRAVAIAAAESGVEAAEAALRQGESQLTQVSGSARNERVAAQQALVRQMQAAVAAVQVQANNTSLTAPFAGVVTGVMTEVGQIVSASAPAVSLISQDQYELVVSISEVDIAEISQGDEAAVRFDAYEDDYFQAHVERISPNATLIDGVRVFAVTLLFDEIHEKIRAGLSADIDITTAKRADVIAVPTRAIYEDSDGKFVRVITDKTTVSNVRVETGLRSSDGKTEIVSGLQGGETIVTFANEESIKQLDT